MLFNCKDTFFDTSSENITEVYIHIMLKINIVIIF